MRPVTCFYCDEEFTVKPLYETASQVAYCPYCGNEVDESDEELDFDGEDDDENYRD